VRERPQGDRLALAWLAGETRHHAVYREPYEDEITAAVAALRAITTRPDLLAERAGILLGFYDEASESEQVHAAASVLYLVEAGADLASLLYWIDEGAERANRAGQLPFSGTDTRRRPAPPGRRSPAG
jgi:hypothetical protein